MQYLKTVPQDKALNRRVQAGISEDAYLRIIVAARRERVTIGELLSRLALEHLPAVDAGVAV